MGARRPAGGSVKAQVVISALILVVLLCGVCEYHRVTREAERERAREAVDDCFEWHVANRTPAQVCVDMAQTADQ